MSDGYVTVFVEVLPESLAEEIVRSLTYDEVLEVVLAIDSSMHDWSFTTDLINKLKESIGG